VDSAARAATSGSNNKFPGAPVLLGRETIKGGTLRAIFANSKVSNVATGATGLENARRMAAAAADEVNSSPEKILVSSTGVIGVRLPIEIIEDGVRGMSTDLVSDPIAGAEGIMTTDTYPKALSMSVGDATITWVAKGSGMIQPNMATMLAYIFTDAAFDARTLDRLLRQAVDVSFNMLSVDSDTSTSDTCAMLANGLAGHVDERAFLEALTAGSIKMTEMLARDGEGATHLLRTTVRGAKDISEARSIARSLVNSPLIKTMVYGADPNVGRILMAVGKCVECTIDRERTSAWINGHDVLRDGVRLDFDDGVVRTALGSEVVDIIVSLGVGDAQATAYGCDLTQGYIDENAAYYSS
jgi:glutamate N-acetyltransferase/amino-acid N-acetyltransferase